MKNQLLLLAAVIALAELASAQQRVDTFTAPQVESATLRPLSDGGCQVSWCGTATSTDGGVTDTRCTPDVELRNATNRNRCDALLTAGEGRLGRELRFPVDAGAP